MPRLHPSDPIAHALASFRAICAQVEERAELAEIKDADAAVWDVALERRLHRTVTGFTPLDPEPEVVEPTPDIGTWRLDQQ